ADFAAGFRYHIVEGSTEVKRTPFLKRPTRTKAAIAADNQPRPFTTWLVEPVPLPFPEKGPGLLEIRDLREPDRPACYALFRRYLFDWRTDLELPLLLLIDEQSRAHKFYASPPSAAEVAQDLAKMGEPDRLRLALPFAGTYYATPHRNYFKLGGAFY